jgi:hypothetical protein
MNKLITIVLALLPIVAAANTGDLPDPDTMSRLLAGEVVLEDTRTDEAGGAARVEILVRAPVEDIWSVIVTCENALVFVEGLKTCEVLEDSGEYAVTHQIVKKGFPIPTQDFTFETRRVPYSRMEFKLLEGNLKAMEGSWDFIEVPEGIVIIYEVRVQPGVPAPRFMVRRNMRKGMPDMLACIRGLAGGSGSEKKKAKDLDRCPGDIDADSADQ